MLTYITELRGAPRPCLSPRIPGDCRDLYPYMFQFRTWKELLQSCEQKRLFYTASISGPDLVRMGIEKLPKT